MKTHVIALAAILSARAVFAIPSASPEARITALLNKADVQCENATPHAAALKEALNGRASVKTRANSKAELTFADQSRARLGANTTLEFHGGARDLSLANGAILFQSPRRSSGARVAAGAVTAEIAGATALIETQQTHGGGRRDYVKLIVLEGTARVFLSHQTGESELVSAGRMVILSPNAKALPEPVDVDLARLVATSKLVSAFGKLPVAPLVDAEIARQSRSHKTGELIATNLAIRGEGTKLSVVGNAAETLQSLQAPLQALAQREPMKAASKAAAIPTLFQGEAINVAYAYSSFGLDMPKVTQLTGGGGGYLGGSGGGVVATTTYGTWTISGTSSVNTGGSAGGASNVSAGSSTGAVCSIGASVSGATLNGGGASLSGSGAVQVTNGGGTVFGGTLGLSGSVAQETPSGTINISEATFSGPVSFHAGINIAINSQKTSGPGITVTNTGQILALLDAAAPGPGGAITFTTAGADIDIAGTLQADQGAITVQNNGAGGAIRIGGNSAILRAEIVKVGALAADGVLTITNGAQLSAGTLLRLYGGDGPSGKVLFTGGGAIALSGNAIQIGANTVQIASDTHVNNAGPTTVFAGNHLYTNGGAGGGAFQNPVVQQPLSARPPF